MNLPFLEENHHSYQGFFIYFSLKTEETKLINKQISYGNENPDKSFLVIRINNPILGLMAIYNSGSRYLRIAGMEL